VPCGGDSENPQNLSALFSVLVAHQEHLPQIGVGQPHLALLHSDPGFAIVNESNGKDSSYIDDVKIPGGYDQVAPRIRQHVEQHLPAEDPNAQSGSIDVHLDERVRIQCDDGIAQPYGSLFTDTRADVIDGCCISGQLKTR